MPKLLLLGATDPYWTVDSVRHYLPHLEGVTSLQVSPNGGHGAGMDAAALDALGVWARLVFSGARLPSIQWASSTNGRVARFVVRSEREAEAIHFFGAESKTRDFRQATWSKAAELAGPVTEGEHEVRAAPGRFQAALARLELPTDEGTLVLTSAPKVVPDEE
jgi:PhoPQ-activated pathogenicity-related protein